MQFYKLKMSIIIEPHQQMDQEDVNHVIHANLASFGGCVPHAIVTMVAQLKLQPLKLHQRELI